MVIEFGIILAFLLTIDFFLCIFVLVYCVNQISFKIDPNGVSINLRDNDINTYRLQSTKH